MAKKVKTMFLYLFKSFLPRFLTLILKQNRTTKRLVIPLFLSVPLCSGTFLQILGPFLKRKNKLFQLLTSINFLYFDGRSRHIGTMQVGKVILDFFGSLDFFDPLSGLKSSKNVLYFLSGLSHIFCF